MKSTRKRLVLIGGGHVHLSVLQALIKQCLDIDVIMITPSTYQTYSGMLPGWMAGHYSMSECHIDLYSLVEAANVELILDRVTEINADLQYVKLSNNTQLEYDFLSVDVGSETNRSWVGALGKRLLPIRPLNEFTKRWQEIVADIRKKSNFNLIVVGAGAAGVEIALTAKYVFEQQGFTANVALVASKRGILPGHGVGVKKKVRDLLKRRGIILFEAEAVGTESGVLLDNNQHLYADIVIAATGSTSPYWLRTSHLALDKQGFISVDATHQSISHPNVFAAGDVCTRIDLTMDRSGVHAVFAGPVVAHNLISKITGGKLIRYYPRKYALYLMSTGPKYAIASWGPLTVEGNWIWRWKSLIDQKFINKFSTKQIKYIKTDVSNSLVKQSQEYT